VFAGLASMPRPGFPCCGRRADPRRLQADLPKIFPPFQKRFAIMGGYFSDDCAGLRGFFFFLQDLSTRTKAHNFGL
jgi:hypothetical protein